MLKIKRFNEPHSPVELHYDSDIFIIDNEDLKKWIMFSYFPVKKHKNIYLVRNGDTGTVPFHRDIMQPPDGFEIDHIDGNTRNNKKSNLRIVSRCLNANNIKHINKKKTSKYRGVYWCSERKKFFVQCRFNKKTKTIGRYDCEIEAAVAFDNYIIKNKLPKLTNFHGLIQNEQYK